jgi:putative ABC transport system ATP-binding protein
MRSDMEEGLFRFIWTRSRRRQIIALALTLGSLPLLYLSLELPKAIINEAIGGDEWPRQLLSQSIDQLPYLLLLCLAFISLVVNSWSGCCGSRCHSSRGFLQAKFRAW